MLSRVMIISLLRCSNHKTLYPCDKIWKGELVNIDSRPLLYNSRWSVGCDLYFLVGYKLLKILFILNEPTFPSLNNFNVLKLLLLLKSLKKYFCAFIPVPKSYGVWP